MTDDFQHAAGAREGGFVSVLEVNGDLDLERSLGVDAHQVEVQRTVRHRVELNGLGDDRLGLFAVLQGHQVAQQLAGVERLAEVLLVHRDRDGGLVATVQDAGHSARATDSACAAGACAFTDVNVQNDLGHRARLNNNSNAAPTGARAAGS
ncbi:hypothetical protein D3C80_1538100 [compost metagenome]